MLGAVAKHEACSNCKGRHIHQLLVIQRVMALLKRKGGVG